MNIIWVRVSMPLFMYIMGCVCALKLYDACITHAMAKIKHTVLLHVCVREMVKSSTLVYPVFQVSEQMCVLKPNKRTNDRTNRNGMNFNGLEKIYKLSISVSQTDLSKYIKWNDEDL